jgi:hypothetical protein
LRYSVKSIALLRYFIKHNVIIGWKGRKQQANPGWTAGMMRPASSGYRNIATSDIGRQRPGEIQLLRERLDALCHFPPGKTARETPLSAAEPDHATAIHSGAACPDPHPGTGRAVS